MIIAVDFDGTLQINGQPNGALIADLRAKQAQGSIVSYGLAERGTG